jgi:hypothetical protein
LDFVRGDSMTRTELYPGFGVPSALTYTRALLFGSVYGIAEFDDGLYAPPLFGSWDPMLSTMVVYPSEADVKRGVHYGSNGTEYTGTLSPGGVLVHPGMQGGMRG